MTEEIKQVYEKGYYAGYYAGVNEVLAQLDKIMLKEFHKLSKKQLTIRG